MKNKNKATGDASKSLTDQSPLPGSKYLVATAAHFGIGEGLISPFSDPDGLSWDFATPDQRFTIKVFSDARYSVIKPYVRHGWSHNAMFIFDLDEQGGVHEYNCPDCRKRHLDVPSFINLSAKRLSALIYRRRIFWWSTFNNDWEPAPLWRDRKRSASGGVAGNI